MRILRARWTSWTLHLSRAALLGAHLASIDVATEATEGLKGINTSGSRTIDLSITTTIQNTLTRVPILILLEGSSQGVVHGLAAHQRIAAEDHFHDIIKALCKVAPVRDEFGHRRYNQIRWPSKPPEWKRAYSNDDRPATKLGPQSLSRWQRQQSPNGTDCFMSGNKNTRKVISKSKLGLIMCVLDILIV